MIPLPPRILDIVGNDGMSGTPPLLPCNFCKSHGVDVGVCDLDEHVVFRGNYREFRATREFQRLFVSTVLRGTENFHCHWQISHSQIPQQDLGVELAVRCAIANL